ncbi:hypothetical protein D3C76_713890 [compost metagenome]
MSQMGCKAAPAISRETPQWVVNLRCTGDELGVSANASWVRLCMWVKRNTCDTYNLTVFSVMPSSQAIW